MTERLRSQPLQSFFLFLFCFLETSVCLRKCVFAKARFFLLVIYFTVCWTKENAENHICLLPFFDSSPLLFPSFFPFFSSSVRLGHRYDYWYRSSGKITENADTFNLKLENEKKCSWTQASALLSPFLLFFVVNNNKNNNNSDWNYYNSVVCCVAPRALSCTRTYTLTNSTKPIINNAMASKGAPLPKRVQAQQYLQRQYEVYESGSTRARARARSTFTMSLYRNQTNVCCAHYHKVLSLTQTVTREHPRTRTRTWDRLITLVLFFLILSLVLCIVFVRVRVRMHLFVLVRVRMRLFVLVRAVKSVVRDSHRQRDSGCRCERRVEFTNSLERW